MRNTILFLAFFAVSFVQAPAQLINVNFILPMVGRAAAGKDSNDIWNTFNPSDARKAPFIAAGLKDSKGNPTKVSIEIYGAFLDTTTTDGGLEGNLDPALFTYYLLSVGPNPFSLKYSGLSANTAYQLDIYSNNAVKNNGRNFTVKAKGVTKTLLQSSHPTYTSTRDTDDTYSGNYIQLSVTSDDSGDLELNLAATGDNEYDVTGLQLQKVESDPNAIPVLK